MERDRLIQHIEDPLLKQVMTRVIDKAQGVLKVHEIKATDFLTPYEVNYAKNLLSTVDGITFYSSGGYDGAERQVLMIYQDYLDKMIVEIPIVALEARGNTHYQSITHRDYLGAILGLGLKRDKVGDIILHEKDNHHYCHIILHEELKDYVLFNLTKVGNVKVTLQEIPLESLHPPETEYQEFTGTIPSPRLDTVLGVGFRVSRTEAQSFITKEYVSVNWETIKKNFYEVSAGDVISLRGKGRIEVVSMGGTTKSGRIKIIMKKPI